MMQDEKIIWVTVLSAWNNYIYAVPLDEGRHWEKRKEMASK